MILWFRMDPLGVKPNHPLGAARSCCLSYYKSFPQQAFQACSWAKALWERLEVLVTMVPPHPGRA